MIYPPTKSLPSTTVQNALKNGTLLIYVILSHKKISTNVSKRILITRKNKEMETKLDLSKLPKQGLIFTPAIVVLATLQRVSYNVISQVKSILIIWVTIALGKSVNFRLEFIMTSKNISSTIILARLLTPLNLIQKLSWNNSIILINWPWKKLA